MSSRNEKPAIEAKICRASLCETPSPRMNQRPPRRTPYKHHCVALDPALCRAPDEFVHLKLETDLEFLGQNPVHDLARIDPAKNW